ncbi:hypothetical protein Bbelb_414150 [Branchiostoma belcheri]|nr:hypothetical protein Bbelb_414150 [Branchiostoma belcheri]
MPRDIDISTITRSKIRTRHNATLTREIDRRCRLSSRIYHRDDGIKTKKAVQACSEVCCGDFAATFQSLSAGFSQLELRELVEKLSARVCEEWTVQDEVVVGGQM